MVNVCHIENRLLAIAQWFIIRLTRNLVCRSRIMLRHRLHNQNNKFHKFKMAEGRVILCKLWISA